MFLRGDLWNIVYCGTGKGEKMLPHERVCHGSMHEGRTPDEVEHRYDASVVVTVLFFP